MNFGNAFEAVTVHRVLAPRGRERFWIRFFMGLPLGLTVSGVRGFMPVARSERASLYDESLPPGLVLSGGQDEVNA